MKHSLLVILLRPYFNFLMQDLSTKTKQETATHMIYGISTDLKKTVSLYFKFHSDTQPECLVLIYLYILEA